MVSTAELLLLGDQLRERTQQLEIGMSDLGACRRRTGYKIHKTVPVNKRGSVVAAMGSAIHDSVNRAIVNLGLENLTAEQEVEYAGIKGHFDRTEDDKVMVDLKSTSSRYLEHIKLHGADHNHIWQVSCYAAARIQQGYPISHIRIDYLARDTGEEYQWPDENGRPLDPQDIRDALNWLKVVRDTPLDALPRDYEPDSTFCRGCPYGGVDGGLCWENHTPGRDMRSVLFVEDPDAQKWADELWDARQAEKSAKTRAARAKGALSAVVDPGGTPTKVGDRWMRVNANGALSFVSEPRSAEFAL